jgi:hypothetical protein
LFNPLTGGQVSLIRDELRELLDIIDQRDEGRLGAYLEKIRRNIQ